MKSIDIKHTPGPWTFRPDPTEVKCNTCHQVKVNYPWNYLIEGKARSLIAKIWAPVGDSYSDEANAKLIAAAPDLLEACDAVLTKWHSKPSNFNKTEPIYLEQIRKAIKKATE
jgi:hypothetical protein